MKRIFESGKYGPVINNTLTLRSKSTIDEDEYKIKNNGICNYDNLSQLGSFGGTSQVDISLSQTRINLENVVNNTLVATCTFHKHAFPMFKEMTSSCSTKVHFDECMHLIRHQNIKYIVAKSIHSAYGTSNGIVLFGEDKTSQRNIKRH